MLRISHSNKGWILTVNTTLIIENLSQTIFILSFTARSLVSPVELQTKLSNKCKITCTYKGIVCKPSRDFLRNELEAASSL